MIDATPENRGSHFGGTAIAFLVAPICVVIAGGICGAIFGLFSYVMTDSSHWWAVTVVGVVQATSGTYAARLACDTVLKSYSGRAVFVEFVVLVGPLVIASLILLPFSSNRISTCIEVAVLFVMAWKLFWKAEPLESF